MPSGDAELLGWGNPPESSGTSPRMTVVGWLGRITGVSIRWAGPRSSLFHGDGDDLGLDDGGVGDVVGVAEDELEGVGAGGEVDGGFGLGLAEVFVMVVGGDRGLGVGEGLVDQQVVVAGVGFVRPGGGEVHA